MLEDENKRLSERRTLNNRRLGDANLAEQRAKQAQAKLEETRRAFATV